MKRKICFAALLLAVICLLASCGLFGAEPDRLPDNEDEGNHDHLPDNGDEENPDVLPDDGGEEKHEHSYGEWVTISNPTCTEEGLRERTCTCNDKESETISPLGHDEYTYSEKDEDCHILNVTACNRCDYIVKTDSGDESHSYGEWELSSNTTDTCQCEWKPVYIRTCSDCKDMESKTENAPGHSYDPAMLDILTNPTESSAGILSAPCKKCDCCEINIEIPPFNNTDYTVYVIDSTCTKQGEVMYYYIFEGMTFSWEIELPLAEHKYEDLVCKMCGMMAPAGLYDDDGNQLASWDELVSLYGMDIEIDYSLGDYSSVATHPAYVLTNENLAHGSVLILDGSVTRIGDYAFEKCSSLTFIDIPDIVTSIGAMAFTGCSELTDMVISNSVKVIDDGAFSSCDGLADIYFNGTADEWSATEIGTNNEHITNATVYYFSGTRPTSDGNFWRYENGVITIWPKVTDPVYSVGLKFVSTDNKTCYVSGIGSCTDIDILIPPISPEGYIVTGIGKNAFMDCTSIVSILVPDSVTSIDEFAFSGCSSLAYINIPENVESISEHTFYGCSSLIGIELHDDLMSIGDSAFYGCSSLTDVDLPDSITEIGKSAFANCKSLKKITLPKNITSIADRTFHNCKSLVSIVIPAEVKTIGEAAFLNCSSLADVNFLGTERRWNKITIGEMNDSLKNANIEYSTEEYYL